jgi:mannitol-1-phosphate 5-dehydrogenase
MKKKILVQFGAGNIGRSFIGRVFGTSGYEVIFVDINREVIDKLNRDHAYTVVVKKNGVPDREIVVPDVRGILSSDTEAVTRAIREADIMATSVGKNVLPLIASSAAAGLVSRYADHPDKPLNIILAENLHNGAAFFSGELKRHLPEAFPLTTYVGLIETSIGKMVPIMPLDVVRDNPTIVYSEEYNTLILDRKAFIGRIPEIDSIEAVADIAAYVDRKLCIHNLGHAAVSYFGNLEMPDAVYLYEVLEDPVLLARVRGTMLQSAAALLAEYPEVFTREDLIDHIDDLIERFRNIALGDTIFRVGRDLPRKLYRDDRVLGAARLCIKHNLPHDAILDVFRAGTRFKAADEAGSVFPADHEFRRNLADHGIEWTLLSVCGLDPADPIDTRILRELSG